MGPGTGLGAAQLMWDEGRQSYKVWPGAVQQSGEGCCCPECSSIHCPDSKLDVSPILSILMPGFEDGLRSPVSETGCPIPVHPDAWSKKLRAPFLFILM